MTTDKRNMDNRNNRNLKKISVALRMKSTDVRECVGVENYSMSRVSGWMRRENDRRFSRMRDEDFDAFCEGLPDWADRNMDYE